MGYRPHPPDAKIESTLIWYRWDPQLENQEKKRREENVIRIFLQTVFFQAREGQRQLEWDKAGHRVVRQAEK